MTAADLIVLSAGAPRMGVSTSIDAYAETANLRVEVDFATAPVLKERVQDPAWDADVVVAPLPVLDGFEAAGRIDGGSRVVVGAVRAGIVVHADAQAPDVSTEAALKAALLAADRVVHNVASSGQYIAQMIEDLGLADTLAAKTEKTPTGAAVIETIAASAGTTAIGFGQTTEIGRLAHLGAKLVGSLPGDLDKVTVYGAAMRVSAAHEEAARGLLGFLGTGEARALLDAAGVEQG